MSFRTASALVLPALVALLAARAPAQFVNGSFETGDFTGWVTQDLADPLQELTVTDEADDINWVSGEALPTDGNQVASTGFDGAGPGTIFLAQDVTIPASRSMLQFDWAAGWDLADFGAAEDRSFSVVIEPSGGGSALATKVVRTAVAGTAVESTGLTTTSLDLSAFAGQAVRVKFAWTVPEDYTGPAGAELDNVRLVGMKPAASEAASLKIKLDFVNDSSDALSFSTVVPVAEDFDPTDVDVSVSLGALSFDFSLDAAGNGADATDTLALRPVAGQPLLRRLTLKSVQGDFVSGLSDFGIDNLDTGEAGLSVALPMSVTLDGDTTTRTLPMLYKAVEGVKGTASCSVGGAKRPLQLVAKRHFQFTGSDSMSLKASAVTLPGFTPEGVTATVSVGSVSRSFELDADGKGATDDSTLAIKRDKHDPALWTVSFLCPQADLSAEMDADGFTDSTHPKPGLAVPIELELTLDGRVTQILATAKWVATQGFVGVAHAKS
jgi:hypothetical protein